MLEQYIRRIPRAIPDRLCADLSAIADSPSGERLTTSWRKCTLAPLMGDHLAAFARAIREPIEAYRKIAPITRGCTQLERPKVIKYDPAVIGPDHFDEHADAWTVASSTRQISIIAYLNDVAVGGETIFPALDIVQRPERGTLVLFPASFAFSHLAHPPLSGPKYAVVTWLHFGDDAVRMATVPF